MWTNVSAKERRSINMRNRLFTRKLGVCFLMLVLIPAGRISVESVYRERSVRMIWRQVAWAPEPIASPTIPT